MRIIFSVSLLVFFFNSFSQSVVIRGNVVDIKGTAIPFASIHITNTQAGVSADANGFFNIKIKHNLDKLTVYAAGYEKKELVLKPFDTVVTIKLSPQPNNYIKEVVVTGALSRKRGIKVPQVGKKYLSKEENKFIVTAYEPISTFGADVDKASYSYVRRSLNEGQIPPKEVVKIEEMINYFSYNYKEPISNEPYSLISEITDCPWNDNNKILKIGLKGRQQNNSNNNGSHFIFLIDVSGSMQGEDRLDLVKTSLILLLDSLNQNDLISIVTYAGKSGIVLEAVPVSNKNKIIATLDKLETGGRTAGSQGIKTAYEVAEKYFIEEGNNRVVLCTDGDFNVGITSFNALEKLIEDQKESGVFLTCLGFGINNYKDATMDALAGKGNGNYYYIDNIEEARKVLQRDFKGTINTIAKDVKLQLSFNSQFIKAYRLIGYENRLLDKKDFDDDKKDAGEIGEGHNVTVLYELILTSSKNYNDSSNCPKSIQNSESNTIATIKSRYKLPNSSKSKKIEYLIMNSSTPFSTSSNDTKWATIVAMFGLQLSTNTPSNEKKLLKLIQENFSNLTYEQKEMVELIKTCLSLKTQNE